MVNIIRGCKMSASRVRWNDIDEVDTKMPNSGSKLVASTISLMMNTINTSVQRAAGVNGNVNNEHLGIAGKTSDFEADCNAITVDVKEFSAQSHFNGTTTEVPVGDNYDAVMSNGESKESQIKDTSEETRKNENDDQVYNDKVEEPYDIQPSTNVSNSPNTPVMPEDEKRFENLIQLWKHQGNEATVIFLSALYCIILVVMGLAIPTAAVLSKKKLSVSYYEVFYIYLYMVATAFLIYVYVLLKKTPTLVIPGKKTWNWLRNLLRSTPFHIQDKTSDMQIDSLTEVATNHLRTALTSELDPTKNVNHGSFYLRIGAVAFGIGSMIYSVLEFGQYFDLKSDASCNEVMVAVTPAARMIFTFLQMYFVFLNAKMQMVKHISGSIARFGLMHMVATNLCVWLNVIIQETIHETAYFDHLVQGPHDPASDHSDTNVSSHSSDTIHATSQSDAHSAHSAHSAHHRSIRSSSGNDCLNSNLMSSIVENAGPFLFPCAIEYSLICAAIMYEIWKDDHDHHANHQHGKKVDSTPGTPSSGSLRRSPHHYSVDCTNANKGLFFGIFVLVFTIISMIFFVVLINRKDYKEVAVTEVILSELILYLTTFTAVLIGMIQIRQLRFNATRSLDLDSLLLIVAMCGLIAYNIFTIICAQFSSSDENILVFITALSALVQGISQTLFILDATKRNLFTRRHQQRKPGREIITFLLVTNFAMWAVTTLEKSFVDAHPLQLDFFGKWEWAIITNVLSAPLAIFYRYHSTVCLCEIWKRSYKLENNFPF